MHAILPLLQLVNLIQRVDGRKKLQKIVHILQSLGAPFLERFEYSYYGMYSSQLRAEIDKLEAENLVEEVSTLSGANVSFCLKSKPELTNLLLDIGISVKPEWGDIAERLASFSAQKLEGVSTWLFLSGQGFSGGDLKDRLLRLKPHLGGMYDDCANEAQQLLSMRKRPLAA